MQLKVQWTQNTVARNRHMVIILQNEHKVSEFILIYRILHSGQPS